MRSIALVLVTFALIACSTDGGDDLEQSLREEGYDNSFEFLWEQAQKAMTQEFRIAEKKLEERQLVSEWDVNLAYFSHVGYRTRLRVDFEENDAGRVLVKVTEQKETNTQEINPSSLGEAEWEPSTADGAAAARFELRFKRLVNPPQDWRDSIADRKAREEAATSMPTEPAAR